MRTLSTVAIVLSLSVLTGAQDPQKMFRSAVQTVPIYATVVDANGRLVPDLNQEDFEVFDNGKAAPIAVFDKEVQPIAVVITVDTSGSMTLALDFVKIAAETFVLRLLPADRAIIATFADKVRFSAATFTSNRDQLIRYLRNDVQYGNGTALWDALYQGTAMLDKESSRKVVLVLSDGENTSGDMDGEDVLSRAQDSHTMVYAIGMRNQYREGPAGPWVMTRPDRFLRKLTSQTGGGHFEITGTTELNSTFTRVADELHRQYLIGITPMVLDGKDHKIEVRVKKPGMTSRARKSYVATKKAPAP